MLPGFPPRRPLPEGDVFLADLSVVVIDFETTGLYPNQGDEIVELGAVHVDGFEIREERSFERLVNPGRRVSEAAFKVHRIPDALLAEQPPISEILPAFVAFLEGRVLVGQNIVFDLSFLVKSLRDCSMPMVANTVLDTKWLSRLVFPRVTHHSLDAIADRLSVDRPRARHRALGDVVFTAEVLVRLLRRCRDLGFERIGDLMEAYEALEGGRYGDREILSQLENCYLQRQMAEIVYDGSGSRRSRSEDSQNLRKVSIYHFSPPYFVGYCHSRNAIRTFRTDRVARVEVLEAGYGIPEDFHPQDHFLRWGK